MPEQDSIIKNVKDDEYDGRDFVPEDNQDGVEHYIGVDPIYQNYANETEKPHPFSDEEIENAARRGGVAVDANSDRPDNDPDESDSPAKSEREAEDKGDSTTKAATAKKSTTTKSAAASPPLRTSVPEQKSSEK